MWQDNKARIMELFVEEPSRYFQIREAARLTKIAHTSVKNHLEELTKEGLLKKIKTNIYYSYAANQQNEKFTLYKQLRMLWKLRNSGLIGYLENELHPRCIILFGSARKGEYVKTSDIDIFVQTKKASINLAKFEKKLKHKISLFFEENINNLSTELFNNIINGIKLSGYLKIK